ncbi:MAG: DUF1553 domain-containing protein [Planctomycetaceae bacterium]|nr:DUF1553 domain-containing protein [Planctomycetaceae bacterium]
MSTQQPPHSDSSRDDDLSRLLQRAYDCEPPREEFVASLAERLEAELDELSTSHAERRITEVGKQASTTTTGRYWRRTIRSIAAIAAVAVVVIAALIGTSRPSYSWTSMLRALEAQAWVESTVEDAAQQESHGWFSQKNQLVVLRTGDEIQWNDWQDGLQSQYRSGSGVLLRERLGEDEPRSTEASLLAFLRAGISGTEIDDARGLTVLSESWQKVGAGENQQIELNVILGRSESDPSPLHLLVTLDPKTQLPLKCQLIGDHAAVSSTVRFAYPEEGPQQVYDVGVPRDVVVRDVVSPDVSMRTASIDPKVMPQADLLLPTTEESPAPVEAPEEPPVTTVPDEPATPPVDSAIAAADADPLPSLDISPPVPVVASSAEMSRRVDELMSVCWDSNGIAPAGMSTDEEFFRRVSLDLTGRVPTVSECREFMADPSVNRRKQLVEQLLSRRDYATHLGAVWRKMLLPDGVDLSMYGGSASFEEWLSDRFRENMPYDELVRQLLLAEGRVSESGPILFYTALNLKPEQLAAQTSRAFLGIRLECAQCHDHFFDKRLKQTDFWGLAAFFAQISQPEGKMDRVSPVLRVADTDHGEVTLPDTEDVISPHFLLGSSLDKSDHAPSRRRQLAEWITATDNPHFARATVNRVWAHLFGRGLVDPVDDMRIDNPPVCPEVLDELAGYFVATSFDLRDLFHVIVNSQTYQLSSRSVDDDPARTLHFAQMNIKTFTAEQLYDSISVATRLEPLGTDDGSLVRSSNVSRQSFLEQFRAPPGQVTDYQAGIPQALTLMNGGLMHSATDLRSSGILKSLEAPFFTDEQRVNTLFLATLSRQPDDAERQEMLDYVLSKESGKAQRLSDVLWVLLNSAEFTLNH